MDARTTPLLPGASNGPCEHLKLALVIPTLCEAGNIARLLRAVHAALEPLDIRYEIVVVDDDSGDGTGAAVSAIAREDARVRLVVRKGARGLSGAILDGWRQTDAEVLGVMDADFQHPPELLRDLFAAIRGGSDLAIASRYAPGGGLGQWNSARRLASALAVCATWPLQPKQRRARDPLSGFFLVRRHCLRRVVFQRTGFKLLLEILVRGRIGSIQEVPFTFGRRFTGTSKASLRIAWDYARLMARLYAGRLGLAGEYGREETAPQRWFQPFASAEVFAGRENARAHFPFCPVAEPTRPGGDFLKGIGSVPHGAMAISKGEAP